MIDPYNKSRSFREYSQSTSNAFAKGRTGHSRKTARFVPIGPKQSFVHRSLKAAQSILIFTKIATEMEFFFTKRKEGGIRLL